MPPLPPIWKSVLKNDAKMAYFGHPSPPHLGWGCDWGDNNVDNIVDNLATKKAPVPSPIVKVVQITHILPTQKHPNSRYNCRDVGQTVARVGATLVVIWLVWLMIWLVWLMIWLMI